MESASNPDGRFILLVNLRCYTTVTCATCNTTVAIPLYPFATALSLLEKRWGTLRRNEAKEVGFCPEACPWGRVAGFTPHVGRPALFVLTFGYGF